MRPWVFICLVLLCLALVAQTPPPLTVDGKVIGKYVKPKPGEVCRLCYAPVHADDIVYLVSGQRVPVHAGAEDEAFRQDPKRWLAGLRPHGAFLGTSQAGEAGAPALSRAWFFFGSYVLLGLVFAALCAHCAFRKGQSPRKWFTLGLLFNACGFLALLIAPKREVQALTDVPPGLAKIPLTYTPEGCPQCGASNHPSARKCLDCGADLKPIVVSEVDKLERG